MSLNPQAPSFTPKNPYHVNDQNKVTIQDKEAARTLISLGRRNEAGETNTWWEAYTSLENSSKWTKAYLVTVDNNEETLAEDLEVVQTRLVVKPDESCRPRKVKEELYHDKCYNRDAENVLLTRMYGPLQVPLQNEQTSKKLAEESTKSHNPQRRMHVYNAKTLERTKSPTSSETPDHEHPVSGWTPGQKTPLSALDSVASTIRNKEECTKSPTKEPTDMDIIMAVDPALNR